MKDKINFEFFDKWKTTLMFMEIKDNLNFWLMEDNLNIFLIGRPPQFLTG
jgi:hypothetical protein